MPNSVVWINNINEDIGSGYTRVQNIDTRSYLQCRQNIRHKPDFYDIQNVRKFSPGGTRIKTVDIGTLCKWDKKADRVLPCMRFKKVKIDRVCTWFKVKIDLVYSRAKKVDINPVYNRGRHISGLHGSQKG